MARVKEIKYIFVVHYAFLLYRSSFEECLTRAIFRSALSPAKQAFFLPVSRKCGGCFFDCCAKSAEFFLASVCFSPILAVAEYRFEEYWDGSLVPVCVTPADTFWKAAFFIGTISLFFGIPLVLLVALYSVIARHLMVYPGIMAANQQSNQQPITPNAIKYRKQVVMMLGTVVLSFFICLLPFRAFTLWIIVVPPEDVMALGAAGYYNLLFFCRIMLYLNSAINPILYNLMSSKFRDGFMRLCGVRRCKKSLGRKGTFNTTTSTTTCSSNNRMSPEGFWRRSLTRGSLGGDSLRGILQRKASTTSSDSASGPSERLSQHSVVAVRRIDSTLPPALPPQLNGVHRPLMENVLEDVLEDEAQRVLDESFV